MSEEVAVRRDLTPWEMLKEESYAIGKSKMFPHIDTPEKAIAVSLLGRDLGLSVSQSIWGINLIGGRPSLSANIMSQLIFKHHGGNALLYTETTPETCTLRYKRKDADEGGEFTYTLEDAKRAALTSKDVWKKSPAEMLRARALSSVARMVFPDVIGGAYLADELEKSPPPTRVTMEDYAEDPPPAPKKEPEQADYAVVTEEDPTPITADELTVQQPQRVKVDEEAGEVVPVPMTEEQKTRILAHFKYLNSKEKLNPDLTHEQAGRLLTKLIDMADRQRAKEDLAEAKKQEALIAAAKKKEEERIAKDMNRQQAQMAKDNAAVGAALDKAEAAAVFSPPAEPSPPAPQSPAQVMAKRLLDGQKAIHAVSGYTIHLTEAQLADAEVGGRRRDGLSHFYNALVSGRGEGALTEVQTVGIKRLLKELHGHENIPEIISATSAEAFVQELLIEKKTKAETSEAEEVDAWPSA